MIAILNGKFGRSDAISMTENECHDYLSIYSIFPDYHLTLSAAV